MLVAGGLAGAYLLCTPWCKEQAQFPLAGPAERGWSRLCRRRVRTSMLTQTSRRPSRNIISHQHHISAVTCMDMFLAEGEEPHHNILTRIFLSYLTDPHENHNPEKCFKASLGVRENRESSSLFGENKHTSLHLQLCMSQPLWAMLTLGHTQVTARRGGLDSWILPQHATAKSTSRP